MISKISKMNVLLYILIMFIANLTAITIDVKLDGSGDFSSIQAAIEAANANDIVLVYPGTYYENMIIEDKNIVVASLEFTTSDSQYIDSTIIDGQEFTSCFEVRGSTTQVRIQGFTIRNGRGSSFWQSSGGGVLVYDHATLYLENCKMRHNEANLGGAISARHGFIQAAGLHITANSAVAGGGIYLADESTMDFSSENLCNIYNNNGGYGADINLKNTAHINVVVDTFTVSSAEPYYAFCEQESTISLDIQNHWLEQAPHDLYVATDGDDNNSGLSPDQPLQTIAWAVRKIEADEEIARTIHVAAGEYSHAANNQIYPIGAKKNIKIIGEDMDSTIIICDYAGVAICGAEGQSPITINNFTFQVPPYHPIDGFFHFFKPERVNMKNIVASNNLSAKLMFHSELVHLNLENIKFNNNQFNNHWPVVNIMSVSGTIKNMEINNNEQFWATQTSGWDDTQVALDALVRDTLTIESSSISNNSTNCNAGRIIRLVDTTAFGEFAERITLKNCLISNNSINGIKVIQSTNRFGVNEFINCTIVDNTAFGVDNDFYTQTIKAVGDINITNSILHNDNDYEVFLWDDTQFGEAATLNVKNSNIKNGEVGIYNMNNANTVNWLEGNISADPLVATEDKTLTADSPCIDAGTPETADLFLPPWDLAHNQRIWDGDGDGEAIIDMGCYEFDSEYCVIAEEDQIPENVFQLTNYPNPFSTSNQRSGVATTIEFTIPDELRSVRAGEISIYNIKGQTVRTLKLRPEHFNEIRSRINWDGRDRFGQNVSSGVYLYYLKIGFDVIKSNKMLMLK